MENYAASRHNNLNDEDTMVFKGEYTPGGEGGSYH